MTNPDKSPHSGSTLMESVISIGVLAVAVPMILAAIAESGRTGEASGAETRAPWIAAAVFDELRAASIGQSEHITAHAGGRVNLPGDEVLAIGFSRSGGLVDRVTHDQYESGIRESGVEAIRFIARVHPAPEPSDGRASPATVPAMRVTVEYPASAPATRRRTLDFHAQLR